MGLKGKMVSQICIKSDGDVFHEIYRERPHHISDMSPDRIKTCDLHQGQWGTAGSLISWKYFLDGKERVAKEIIEELDDEKKSVTFKVIEGELADIYKNMKITVHVDTSGEDNLVTWTLEYEKVNMGVPDPHAFMGLLLHVTKDMESHHLSNVSTT